MNLKFWKRDKPETRSTGSGYTTEILAARQAWISGQSGLGELTATVQAAIGLWESGLSIAAVEGTDYLTPDLLGIVARSLALRGESVLYATPDRLVPASDWDLSTQYGKPKAYRLSVPETGGGRTVTALAAEVLHFRIGSDCSSPWTGSSPLSRASLSAGMLHSIESALSEVFEFAPLGSAVLPFPESPQTDMDKLASGFRGKRGRILLRESTAVVAAGGPGPQQDWRANDLTPDLSKSMTVESLEAARSSILSVFGILPSLFAQAAQGPLVREAQRHLAQWMLQPIANAMAAEASDKLGGEVSIDVMQPLQAFDAGLRARSALAVVELLARAKEAGVDADKALSLVNWAD